MQFNEIRRLRNENFRDGKLIENILLPAPLSWIIDLNSFNGFCQWKADEKIFMGVKWKDFSEKFSTIETRKISPHGKFNYITISIRYSITTSNVLSFHTFAT